MGSANQMNDLCNAKVVQFQQHTIDVAIRGVSQTETVFHLSAN
jgi:hypothetical protein